MPSTRRDALATRLFTGVMAPLVLGGELRPGRPIGSRAALEIDASTAPDVDPQRLAQVDRARLRRARALAAVDSLRPPSAQEWALCAALHDVLQSANPTFDSALRRRGAVRLLDFAHATLERVAPPANALEALSRHTWLARVLDVTRTDTLVSWWSGSQAFLGAEPPSRLKAWPELRKVRVTRATRALFDFAPPPPRGERFASAVAKLLAHTPLTDLTTCTRAAPPFVWTAAAASLATTSIGRELASRALAPMPAADVDRALGQATRAALAAKPPIARAVLRLLADRAIDAAAGRLDAGATAPDADARLARQLGAAAALHVVATEPHRWRDADLRRLRAELEPIARGAADVLRSVACDDG